MNKICHLTSAHKRYNIRIFTKQILSLIDAGYDATLIVADNKKNGVKSGVKIIDAGYVGFGRLGRMIVSPMMMLKKATKVNADVYHFHDPELIPMGLVLHCLGKKVVYDVHEDYPKAILSRHYMAPWLRKSAAFFFKLLEEFAVRRFSAIVSATPGIAEKFEKINQRSIIVQNFPILDELVSDKKTLWENRIDAVAYVGGISIPRGAVEMVKAVNSSVPDLNESILFLAGDFSPESLKKKIMELDKKNCVKYLGYISRKEVATLLGKIKAGLVLLHPEPFYVNSQPIKMFEYMSAGIPLIVSDFPLWRQLVKSVACGLLVDPLKPDQIAEAIAFIEKNPEVAEKMGRNGKLAVHEKYNWDVEKNKLIELYKDLLPERREPNCY